MRNYRKRTYNDMMGESEISKIKNDELIKTKKKLEQQLDEAELSLRMYEEKERYDIDSKNKLEELKDAGIIDSNYNLIYVPIMLSSNKFKFVGIL